MSFLLWIIKRELLKDRGIDGAPDSVLICKPFCFQTFNFADI